MKFNKEIEVVIKIANSAISKEMLEKVIQNNIETFESLKGAVEEADNARSTIYAVSITEIKQNE